MKITLKTTGRKDLAQKYVDIVVDKVSVTSEITYPKIQKINIARALNGLKDDDQITLRIKQNKLLQSLDCGNLSNISLPSSTALKNFTDVDVGLSISVWISDPTNNSLVKASSKPTKYHFKDIEENDTPIVFSSRSTDPFLWELELDRSEKPIIYISKDIEIKDKLKKNSIWLTSIFPEVLRRIFMFMFSENMFDDLDEDWISLWKAQADDLDIEWPSDDDEIPSDEQEDWINNFIMKFMEKNLQSFFNAATLSLNQDEEE